MQDRVFNCQQILRKIYFVIFDIVNPQHFDHCDDEYLFSIRVQIMLNIRFNTLQPLQKLHAISYKFKFYVCPLLVINTSQSAREKLDRYCKDVN